MSFLREAVGRGGGLGLLIPTRLLSWVRNRHSKIKEVRMSGIELIGELPQKLPIGLTAYQLLESSKTTA